MTNSSDAKGYSILWSKQAISYLERLDKPTKQRISIHVEWLAANPADHTLDIQPIVGNPGIFRLRVGKYRIIFSIEEEIKVIAVSTIMPRGEVYKHL